MTLFEKRALATSTISFAMAGPALAHPGDHALSVLQSLAHLLTEPDHLALLVLVLGVGILAFSRLRRTRTK